MQHLDFSLRAMAQVDRYAAIVGIEPTLVGATGKLGGGDTGHCAVFQIQNIPLHVMQQAVRGDIRKGIDIPFAGSGQLREHIDIVASQFSPGGQQRIR